MLQSELFPSTQKQAPKDAVSTSHKLLVQAGYIDQLASGIWSFLPLGWKVHKKISDIIRYEINKIGGQELFMPAFQPKELWIESGRWDTIDPPLFKIKDRHKKELALGSTHEEVITYLARKFVKSYKDTPLALYQIQTKFRNELRATAGLLRTREFIMKDLYSFHENEKDLDIYYKKVQEAYKNIFKACGLNSVMVEASSGTIGGKESHEFMVLSETGEDKIKICECGFGVNLEVGNSYEKCPKCGGKLVQKNSIEIGHIFKLGTTYSQKMNANFLDKEGKQKPLVMGCYGIGLGRLLATIIEVSNDSNGIIWPNKNVAPFIAHLILLDKNQEKDSETKKKADKIYSYLQEQKIEVLYDDRKLSPGIKFKDADLIGIPIRLVVSEKTGDKIEFKKRDQKESELLDIKEIIERLN